MKSQHGHVYALTNPFMPTLYKVGRTVLTPESRAQQLSSATGVPSQFELAIHAAVDDPADCERRMHDQLSEFRVNSNREFFRVPFEILLLCFEYLNGRPKVIYMAPAGWRETPNAYGYNPYACDPGVVLAAFNSHVERWSGKDLSSNLQAVST